jgi:hypothetical protein
MVILNLAFAGQIRGSNRDQKTIATFNSPVEIPGKALTPGTYVFKVLDTSGGSRDIIQVLNKDETKVIATFIAIPAAIDKPLDKPFIKFAERAASAPPAIEAWFYPGRTDGHEFVYPRQHASELAKANNQNVPSMPDNLKSNVTELPNSTTPPSTNDLSQQSFVEMNNATLTDVTPEDQDVATEPIVFAIALITPAEVGSEMQTDSAHKQKRSPPKSRK